MKGFSVSSDDRIPDPVHSSDNVVLVAYQLGLYKVHISKILHSRWKLIQTLKWKIINFLAEYKQVSRYNLLFQCDIRTLLHEEYE